MDEWSNVSNPTDSSGSHRARRKSTRWIQVRPTVIEAASRARSDPAANQRVREGQSGTESSYVFDGLWQRRGHALGDRDMTTSSHAAPAARGPTCPMVFIGVEAGYTVFAGIGNAGDYDNEAGFGRVAAVRGFDSAQDQVGIEEFADEGPFAPPSAIGGAL